MKDRTRAIRSACGAVTNDLLQEQLTPATAATATAPAVPNSGAEPRDLARNGTVTTQFGKTNPPSGRPLGPRRCATAALLAAGHSVASAARTLNIGRRTIFRWLNQQPFRAEIDRRLTELSRPRPRPTAPPPRRPSHSPVVRLRTDDDIDPDQLRADMDFVNAIAAEALSRTKWRDLAQSGAKWHGAKSNVQNEATEGNRSPKTG